MRLTLTLDPAVARLVEDAVHRERRSMEQVVNGALRRALAPTRSRDEPYEMTPHHSAVRTGFDLSGFNRLTDELEDETITDAARRTL